MIKITGLQSGKNLDSDSGCIAASRSFVLQRWTAGWRKHNDKTDVEMGGQRTTVTCRVKGEGMEGRPAGRQSKLLRTEAQWRLEEE